MSSRLPASSGASNGQRTTRDVDVVVKVADDREAGSVVFDLRSSGYALVTLVAQKATGRLATARLHPPSAGKRPPVVDMLFASTSIEPEIADAATRLRVV